MNFPKKIHLVNTLIKGCVINGSSVLIKNDVFSSIGLFDESLPYAHDLGLAERFLSEFPAEVWLEGSECPYSVCEKRMFVLLPPLHAYSVRAMSSQLVAVVEVEIILGSPWICARRKNI